MIQLNCIKCGTTLSIDDAFAGGVCRCQHCGAIQKVPTPKRSRPAMPGSIPAAAASAPPPEYAATAAPQPPVGKVAAAGPAAPDDSHLTRVDLENLAQAVATSSGLQSTKLRKSSPSAPAETAASTGVVDYATPQPARSNKGLIIGIAVVVAVLAVVLGFVFFGTSSSRTSVPISPGGNGAGMPDKGTSSDPSASGRQGLDPALTLTIPNFLGVPLKGSTVIYLIDHGQGTVETFDGLRGAIMRSLSTLGPETRFQVIFWDTGSDLQYPTSGPDRATPENIKQAGKVVADAIANGASKIEKPLEKALAGKPDDICIATGKFGLDSAWADDVKKIVSGKGVKVHTFAFGRSDAAIVLKSVAEATGGTFRDINLSTATKLADFAPSSGN